VFSEWGIPTADSIVSVRRASQRIPLIATGGIRSGIDVAKAVALGADVAAMARPMLVAANAGEEALATFIEDTIAELKVCMFGTGAGSLDGLKGTSSLREIHHIGR
jgi:isopentenyl-diphosphate Delta-isomerase